MSEKVLEELLGVIARGWCTPANAHKVMDPDLVEAIAHEILAYVGTHQAEAHVERDAAVVELIDKSAAILCSVDLINPPDGPYWSGAREQEALRAALAPFTAAQQGKEGGE